MGPQPEVRRVVQVWNAVVRAGRFAVVGVTVAIALLGALVGPPAAAFLWAPTVGLVAAVVVALVNPNFPRTPGSRRGTWIAGVAGLMAVPFTSGLGLLDTAGAVIVVLQMILGSLWIVDWIARMPESTGADALRNDITYLRRVLPELSVETLLREWRTSADSLGPDADPGTRMAAAELRAMLIDELSRRDPAAVERWLRTGGGDPAQYLPGRPGQGL